MQIGRGVIRVQGGAKGRPSSQASSVKRKQPRTAELQQKPPRPPLK